MMFRRHLINRAWIGRSERNTKQLFKMTGLSYPPNLGVRRHAVPGTAAVKVRDSQNNHRREQERGARCADAPGLWG